MSEHLLALDADASLQDWITALPSYQQSVITEMLQTRDPEAVAIAWLNARGQTDTAPLGAVQLGATLFYEKLLEQLRAFLCGTASEYEQERGQLAAGAKAGQAAVVTLVAGSVAPVVGVSPVMLAPAVALTLFIVARAGRETACEVLDYMILGLQADGHEASGPPAPLS